MRVRGLSSLVPMALLAGCGASTVITTTQPEATNVVTEREGLRYYAARDLLSVDAKVTYRIGHQWQARVTADSCIREPKEDTVWVTTSWDVGAQPVADRRAVYRLGIEPSAAVQQNLNVTVTEGGLLSSLNYSAQDKTAEIVVNVAKGIAGVAGAAVGLGNLSAVNLDYLVPETSKPKPQERPTDDECYEASVKAKGFETELAGLKAEIEANQQARLTLLKSSVGTGSRRAAETLRLQDSLLAQRGALLDQRRSAVMAARAAARAGYSQHKDTVFSYRARLDLGEVPAALPGATVESAGRSLSDGPMRALLDSAHMLIVVAEPPVTPDSEPARATVLKLFGRTDTSQASGGFGCRGVSDRKCARLYHREARGRELRIYAQRRPGDDAPLDLWERRNVPLVSSNDEVLNIGFTNRKMADGSIKLAFGRYGNVLGVEQVNGASAVGGSAAFANVVSGGRTELLAGVKNVQDIQSAAQTIRENKLLGAIHDLENRKKVIDAQLALDGATANGDLPAQKQAIEAQLALLTSQQSLAAAQANAGRGAELAEVRDQIERMKVQIELLQQQLALKKAQEALQ